MSRYLLNLARRSAGLAPVVRASAPDAATIPDAAIENQAETIAPRVETPKQSAVVVREVMQAPPAQAIEPQRVSAPVPAAIAPLPAPAVGVQRLLAAGVTSPAIPALPIVPSAPAPMATHAPVVVDAVQIDTGATRSVATPSPVAPARFERTERMPETIEPTTQRVPPAPVAMPVDVRSEANPATPPEREELRMVERIIESTRSEAPAPIVVSIRPAESVAAAVPVQYIEAAPERTVHVRIGAIEIYAADAAKAAPAASVLPAAVAASSAPPAGGFDDYAALRSYTPWTW